MRYSKRKAEWVRDYLQSHGPTSATKLHNEFCLWCRENGYDEPKHGSTRRYLSVLKRAGLIEKAGEEPPKSGGFPRTLYGLAASPGDERWENPKEAAGP